MPDSRHKVEFLRPSWVRRVRVMLLALRWLHHALLHHDFEFHPRQFELVGGEAARGPGVVLIWCCISCRRELLRKTDGLVKSENSASSLWYGDPPSMVLFDATSAVAVNPFVDSCIVVSRSRLFRGSTSKP